MCSLLGRLRRIVLLMLMLIRMVFSYFHCFILLSLKLNRFCMILYRLFIRHISNLWSICRITLLLLLWIIRLRLLVVCWPLEHILIRYLDFLIHPLLCLMKVLGILVDLNLFLICNILYKMHWLNSVFLCLGILIIRCLWRS